jgi:hypothetical protein
MNVRFRNPFSMIRLGITSLLVLITVFSLSFLSHAQSNVVGQWSSVMTTPYEAVHMTLLPTGKVIMWSHFEDSLTPQLWDPISGNFTASAPMSYEIFCAGHSLLPNGQVLVSGGNLDLGVGYAHASLYNPFTDTWTSLPDMNAGRWYPNNVTLANGNVVVMSGTIDQSTGDNTLPQVWQPASQTWQSLTGAQLALSAYTHAHLAPNGMVFLTGPTKVSRYLNTSGTGAWTWVTNSNYGTRDYGTSVIYSDGQILLVGGGDPPTNTAEVINLNAASPLWAYTGSMNYARRQHNATALPDGTVLITGGSGGSGFDNSTVPVYAAELWSPASGQFTILASNTVYRGYHSTALLLPDGRVLSAGGDVSGASAEIYSPPYLFNGPQPTITLAPSNIQYGQAFSVTTPDAANIAQVTWLGLGSVTHGFDQNQRFSRLNFTSTSTGLTVTAPTNPNIIPPGYYMLFIVNTSGVPSVASIISISGSVTLSPTSLAFAPQALATASAAQTVTLTNSQSAPLNLSSITTSGDYAQANNCVSPIAPSTNCTISVTFTPTATGTRTGTLTVNDDAASSPQTVTLSGTGVMAVGLSASSLGYGSQVLGTTSTSKAVTLKNNQSGLLTISGITTSGDFAQNNNCASSLAAGVSCTINVTFTPTATSTRSGTLAVSDNASGSPQSVALSGTGIVAVALSASSLGFGSQVVATTGAGRTVTIKNNQSVSLNLSSIGTSGDYAQSNDCVSPIASGGSCTITATFTPTVTGTRTGNLTISDDANSSPQIVALQGTGLLAVGLSAGSLSFGSQALNTSSTAKTVTLKNNQSVALNLSSITSSGEFGQTNNCVTPIGSGASCTISVTFTPSAAGTQTGTLTVTDDANTSPQTVRLSGAGQ